MTAQTIPSVTYQRSPLLDVTFQVTFPVNLQISSAPPVTFQAKVKSFFPNFSLTQDKTSYNFLTADQRGQLLLGQESLAVVARQYEGWSPLHQRITLAMEALQTEYPPPYFSRVGLRFRNIIRRSVLGLTDKEWNHLLQRKWTGDLAWSEVAGEMKATHSQILMSLNGAEDLVCIRHGLTPIGQPAQEMGYLIDHDFFVNGQLPLDTLAPKLTMYHQAAQRFFKLWVTDTLHQAMQPLKC